MTFSAAQHFTTERTFCSRLTGDISIVDDRRMCIQLTNQQTRPKGRAIATFSLKESVVAELKYFALIPLVSYEFSLNIKHIDTLIVF